jgi:hypothetical protein
MGNSGCNCINNQKQTKDILNYKTVDLFPFKEHKNEILKTCNKLEEETNDFIQTTAKSSNFIKNANHRLLVLKGKQVSEEYVNTRIASLPNIQTTENKLGSLSTIQQQTIENNNIQNENNLKKNSILYVDSSLYIGSLNSCGQKTGIGELYFQDGSKYSGSFVNDQMVGSGNYFYLYYFYFIFKIINFHSNL